jgi:hypothetical protein
LLLSSSILSFLCLSSVRHSWISSTDVRSWSSAPATCTAPSTR